MQIFAGRGGFGLRIVGRLFAFYGDSVAFALFRPVIPQREMLRAAVVPQRDCVGAPAKPHLKLTTLLMAKKKVQQRTTFILSEFVDAGGESGIYVERLAGGPWVRADNWMDCAWIDLTSVVNAAVRVTAPVDVFRVMGSTQRRQKFPQLR